MTLFKSNTTPLIALSCVILVVFGAIGCSDDNGSGSSNDDGNGDNGEQFAGESLEISGDIGDQYDGDTVDLGDGVDRLASGTLNSDGTFSFTLTMTENIYENVLEEATESATFSYGFDGLLCIEELSDELEGARFGRVPNILFEEPRGDEEETVYVRAIALASDPEAPAGSYSSFPNGPYVVVSWIYSTDSISLQETCGDHEIDVELERGWNEVMLDNEDTHARVQWTGERPNDVDWYVEPKED